MLLTARLASGEEHPAPTPVDVTAAAQRVVDHLPEFTGSVPTVQGAPGQVACVDGRHLEVMLEQLLTNAARYGAPPVTVTVTRDDGAVEVRVSDGGPGVAPEDLDTLFDRFTQADTGDQRSSTGVGLGLHIVEQLAALNDGEVGYEHRERATFVLRLPRVAVAP